MRGSQREEGGGPKGGLPPQRWGGGKKGGRSAGRTAQWPRGGKVSRKAGPWTQRAGPNAEMGLVAGVRAVPKSGRPADGTSDRPIGWHRGQAAGRPIEREAAS